MVGAPLLPLLPAGIGSSTQPLRCPRPVPRHIPAQPFSASLVSPKFPFWAEMSQVCVCQGLGAGGRRHPALFGAVWGHQGLSTAQWLRCHRRGMRLWQTANVEHKSWWRQGRSEGGRTSKASRAMRLCPLRGNGAVITEGRENTQRCFTGVADRGSTARASLPRTPAAPVQPVQWAPVLACHIGCCLCVPRCQICPPHSGSGGQGRFLVCLRASRALCSRGLQRSQPVLRGYFCCFPPLGLHLGPWAGPALPGRLRSGAGMPGGGTHLGGRAGGLGAGSRLCPPGCSFPRLCPVCSRCRPCPSPSGRSARCSWSCIFRDCGGCCVCKISTALLVLFRLIRSEML